MRLETKKSGAITDNSFSDTGGIVLGPIFLIRDPQLDLEAATKRYVDLKYSQITADSFTKGKIPIGRMPAFDGDLSSAEGTVTLKLKKTKIKPDIYNKVIVNDKGYVVDTADIDQADIPNTLDFTKIINLPTTVEGYGITDVITTDGGGVVEGRVVLQKPGTVTDEAITLGSLKALAVDTDQLETGDIIRKTRLGDVPGFLRCNGAWLQRDDPAYRPLYNVIGGRYGEKTVEVKVGEKPDPNYVPETFFGTEMSDSPGYRMGAGKPWVNQYGFNPNPWPDGDGWQFGGNFPTSNVWPQIIVTKNKVFVLGGSSGIGGWGDDITNNYSDAIYKADINADGSISAFYYYGKLPLPLSRFQAVVTKNKVYVLGGITYGGNSIRNTYWSPISAEGEITGPWTRGPNLSEDVCDSYAVVTKSKIYLTGGTKFEGGYFWLLGQCMGLHLNEDGLATGISDGCMAVPRDQHGTYVESYKSSGRTSVVTKNTIHTLGGWHETGYTGGVYCNVTFDASGTINGTWTYPPNPSNPLKYFKNRWRDHSFALAEAVQTNTILKLIGGRTVINYSESRMPTLSFDIDLQGSYGIARVTNSLPFGYNFKSSIGFATKTRLYILSGCTSKNIAAQLYWTSFSGVTNDYSEFYGGKVPKPAPLVPVYQYVPMFRIPDINDAAYPDSTSFIKL